MRLICPNCAAQYEVAEDAIPESGRDVQCANCGDTWFQEHPAASFSQVATEDDTDAPEDVTPGFEAGADSDLTDEADHRPDAIFDRVDDDLDDPDAAEAMSPQPAFAQTKPTPRFWISCAAKLCARRRHATLKLPALNRRKPPRHGLPKAVKKRPIRRLKGASISHPMRQLMTIAMQPGIREPKTTTQTAMMIWNKWRTCVFCQSHRAKPDRKVPRALCPTSTS